MDRLNLKYKLDFSQIYMYIMCLFPKYRKTACVESHRFPPTLGTIFNHLVHNQGTSLAMIHSIDSALPNGNQICV